MNTDFGPVSPRQEVMQWTSCNDKGPFDNTELYTKPTSSGFPLPQLPSLSLNDKLTLSPPFTPTNNSGALDLSQNENMADDTDQIYHSDDIQKHHQVVARLFNRFELAPVISPVVSKFCTPMALYCCELQNRPICEAAKQSQIQASWDQLDDHSASQKVGVFETRYIQGPEEGGQDCLKCVDLTPPKLSHQQNYNIQDSRFLENGEFPGEKTQNEIDPQHSTNQFGSTAFSTAPILHSPIFMNGPLTKEGSFADLRHRDQSGFSLLASSLNKNGHLVSSQSSDSDNSLGLEAQANIKVDHQQAPELLLNQMTQSPSNAGHDGLSPTRQNPNEQSERSQDYEEHKEGPQGKIKTRGAPTNCTDFLLSKKTQGNVAKTRSFFRGLLQLLRKVIKNVRVGNKLIYRFSQNLGTTQRFDLKCYQEAISQIMEVHTIYRVVNRKNIRKKTHTKEKVEKFKPIKKHFTLCCYLYSTESLHFLLKQKQINHLVRHFAEKIKMGKDARFQKQADLLVSWAKHYRDKFNLHENCATCCPISVQRQ